MKESMERIEALAHARVVEVVNEQEQKLLKRIVALLDWGEFVTELGKFLKVWEHEYRKRLGQTEPTRKTG